MTRGVDTPMVRAGERVTPAVWDTALNMAREHGRVLLRTKDTTNQATTAAAKLNTGAARDHGLYAYTQTLDKGGPVGVWLEPAPGLEGASYD